MNRALQHRADKTCIAKISQTNHLSRSKTAHAQKQRKPNQRASKPRRTPRTVLRARMRICTISILGRWNIPNAFSSSLKQVSDPYVTYVMESGHNDGAWLVSMET